MWTVLQKRSATRPELPDRLSDTGDIYRIFTASLMQATNFSNFLFYSAIRSVPDQPSWVPDWTVQDQQEWGGRVGHVFAYDEFGKAMMAPIAFHNALLAAFRRFLASTDKKIDEAETDTNGAT
jgi:hypothetical protein